jgi:tungstate transport system substrate-binding protein
MQKAHVLALVLALVVAGCGSRGEVVLATTTSTVDSGLLDVLVPRFEEAAGYDVKELALGSGAALELVARGEADVALVHSPQAEQELVAGGQAGRRLLVMHNRFLVVGPEEDPAGVAGATDASDALRRIAATEALFVSRGDDSGTHRFERSLWEAPPGNWYQETGQGMGATLQIAAEQGGYTISDNATYLATRDATGLAVLLDRGRELQNVYHVIEAKGERVNAEGARAFADFMVAPATQAVIASFGVEELGEPLFVPDA